MCFNLFFKICENYCTTMLTRLAKYILIIPQNTITNAEKLLAAADELAQTGECDATEIYSEAHELEQRMHAFLSGLQRRRGVLDMTVIFYSHVHEVRSYWKIETF